MHHTPVHSSWLNKVEAFSSILTRKVLRRGEFDSRDDLVARMLAFTEHRAQTAQPFSGATTPTRRHEPRSPNFCAKRLAVLVEFQPRPVTPPRPPQAQPEVAR